MWLMKMLIKIEHFPWEIDPQKSYTEYIRLNTNLKKRSGTFI